jgi:hypothetical protein
MTLTRQPLLLIGYVSPSIGCIWYPESEQYRPVCLRLHDIVRTADGPRVVVGAKHGGEPVLAIPDMPDVVLGVAE